MGGGRGGKKTKKRCGYICCSIQIVQKKTYIKLKKKQLKKD